MTASDAPDAPAPRPVDAWTVLFAVAERLDRAGHPVVLDGVDIRRAEAAAEALLDALGVERTPAGEPQAGTVRTAGPAWPAPDPADYLTRAKARALTPATEQRLRERRAARATRTQED